MATARLAGRSEIYPILGVDQEAPGALKLAIELERGRRRWHVLHIAAHGTLHPQGWLLSGLQLADGWVGFESLRRRSLQGALLYLSSCESGATSRGTAHLPGWLAAGLGAGAREVMLTLWKVDDASAAAFADRFYAAWAGGIPAGQAASHARAELRAEAAHPFQWAPFVAVGA